MPDDLPEKEELMAEDALLRWLATLDQFDLYVEEITFQLAERDNRAEILEKTIASYVESGWFEDYLACCAFAKREPTVPEMESILAMRVHNGGFDPFAVADRLSRKLTQRELLAVALADYGECRDRAVSAIDIPSLALEMCVSQRLVRRILCLSLRAVDRGDLAFQFSEEQS
jgi:hypothetical protein